MRLCVLLSPRQRRLFTGSSASASATSQTGLKDPSGLVIGMATGRLFVADMNNHQVMVFDDVTIEYGEAAISRLLNP